MYDLDTIVTMNKNPRNLHIYDIGTDAAGRAKFALGNRGEKAERVVRRIANKKDRLGRGLPTYQGVQARRPRIPADAKVVRREDAGRLLLAALGL